MKETKQRKPPLEPSGSLSIDFHPYIPPVPPKEARFLSAYQGTPTNLLGTMVGRNTPVKVNLNGRAEIITEKLAVFIDKYEELTSGMKNSTAKLLQAFVVRLSEDNRFRDETRFSIKKDIVYHLDEFMALRGLKDKKETRRQVAEDLLTLYNVSMGWMEKQDGQLKAFDQVRLCSRATLLRNGEIHFTFAEDFAMYLVGAYEMKVPALYWELNDRYFPNASPLMWKISLQKKMNHGKKNEDILSVKTLLANAPYIPKYDALPRKNEVGRAIIIPLERDLDALEPVVTWEYCNALGAPLTPEQMDNPSYLSFIRMYVKFTWKEYPELGYRHLGKHRKGVLKSANITKPDAPK